LCVVRSLARTVPYLKRLAETHVISYGILVKPQYRPEFVLGLLNSRPMDFFHHTIASQMRGGWFS